MASKNDKNQAALTHAAPGTVTDPVRADDPSADTHVVVTHDYVGAWPRGSVLPLDGLRDLGIDLERLLGLGAVRAYDPERDANTPVTQTLAEAVRSASPPTLPVVPPSVVTTPQELATAIDPSNTVVTGPLPDEPRERALPDTPAEAAAQQAALAPDGQPTQNPPADLAPDTAPAEQPDR